MRQGVAAHRRDSDRQWASIMWAPVMGCTKVSPGCAHCWAEGYAESPATFSRVRCCESMLRDPVGWPDGQRVFVSAFGDIFHADVPTAFLDRVFATMRATPQHVYYVLTKRVDRMAAYLREVATTGLLANVWAGTSVEDETRARERLPVLREVPAARRFVLFEPLLDAVAPEWIAPWLNWVVVGGEVGRACRPTSLAWARALKQEADVQRVPFFMLRGGGQHAPRQAWDALPHDLRRRQIPH